MCNLVNKYLECFHCVPSTQLLIPCSCKGQSRFPHKQEGCSYRLKYQATVTCLPRSRMPGIFDDKDPSPPLISTLATESC